MTEPRESSELRKVWVVEPTAYDAYGINGVYDSLEAAKASRPEIAWVEDDDGFWSPGRPAMDQSGAHIYETEVETLESVQAARGQKERDD